MSRFIGLLIAVLLAFPATAGADSISIPVIGVNAPIVNAESNEEAQIEEDLQQGTVHYANTAVAGHAGNSVIFGHSSNNPGAPGNYNTVFSRMPEVQPGDSITVQTAEGISTYQVTSLEVVEPTAVWVVEPTSTPQLTVITCYPIGSNTQRLVVHSVLASPLIPEPVMPSPVTSPVVTKTLTIQHHKIHRRKRHRHHH